MGTDAKNAARAIASSEATADVSKHIFRARPIEAVKHWSLRVCHQDSFFSSTDRSFNYRVLECLVQ